MSSAQRSWSTLLAVAALVSGLGVVSAILSNSKSGGGDSKAISKTTAIDSTKKADQIDAQASHSHNVYGGFGDNSVDSGFGGGFGGSGLGSFGGGEGGYSGFNSYGDHSDHHRVHDHHHHHDHHGHDHHDHHDGGYHKSLAIKGLLIPLAGVALLGAAAAFVSNPILLQLGVISGTYGRRRRREASHGEDLDESAARLDAQARLNEIQILERFMAQVPKDQMFSQEKKLMASYLSCSGLTEQNACLERLACELHGPGAHTMPEETHVMNIVANEIFNNDLVPVKTKRQMAEAVRLGREGGDCSAYRCQELEALIRPKGQ